MDRFKRLGFSEYSDDSSYRTGLLRELHIDIYFDKRYNLLGRIIDRNIRYIKKSGRLTMLNDCNDVIVDIDTGIVENAIRKDYDDSCKEILFSTCNGLKYKMLIRGSENHEYVFV